MKPLLKPRLALALALCGAVVPFAIVGCGGGNGLIGEQSFDLTPTTFALPNGQIATLTGARKSDNTASGNLTISDAQVAEKTMGQQNAVLASVVFVPKAYSFSGTVDGAGAFDIGGALRKVGATTDAPFRLTGTLPKTTATSYQLTFDGGTPESGTIPPPAPNTTGGATTTGATTAGGTTAGGTTAGGTTAGTTTSGSTTSGSTTAGGTTAGGTTAGGTTTSVTTNMTFSNGIPAEALILTPLQTNVGGDARYKASTSAPDQRLLTIIGASMAFTDSSGRQGSRYVSISLSGSQVGPNATLPLSINNARNFNYIQSSITSDGFSSYFAESGSVTINSLGRSTSLTIRDARLKTSNRSGKTSTVTLNGTITATNVQLIAG